MNHFSKTVVCILAAMVMSIGSFAAEQTGIEVTHHHANFGDVRLHYVTAGDGEPLVLLHGWPQTWYEWRKVIPLLADRYTIIAPDLRGLGDSSRPEDGYDKLTVADDIWRLLNTHLVEFFNRAATPGDK